MKSLAKLLLITSLLLIGNEAYAEPVEGYATYFTVASCVREGNSGIMANGQPLEDEGYICALRSHKFGGFYKVTNLANGKSVEVRHLDFGTNKKYKKRGVIIDLSRAAFEDLGLLKLGKLKVRVEKL